MSNKESTKREFLMATVNELQDAPAISLMSMKDTCEYLGVTRQTIHRWLKQGKLSSYLLANRRLFRKVDLDRFVERSRESILTRYMEERRNSPEEMES